MLSLLPGTIIISGPVTSHEVTVVVTVTSPSRESSRCPTVGPPATWKADSGTRLVGPGLRSGAGGATQHSAPLESGHSGDAGPSRGGGGVATMICRRELLEFGTRSNCFRNLRCCFRLSESIPMPRTKLNVAGNGQKVTRRNMRRDRVLGFGSGKY